MAGARPNLVKLAPLARAARAAGRALPWVHTGQHLDAALARDLARDVGVEPPVQTLAHVPPAPGRARSMALALGPVLAALRPSLVVVVGDVDSTLAGALAARRLGLPLAHVEAGLRSWDRSMPEERNRVRVDALSDLLHVSEPAAARLLRREGVATARIHRAGNVVADQLAWARPRLRWPQAPWARGLTPGAYGLVTLHRPSNVDDPERLARWLNALAQVARDLPLVFPVHPRTRARLGAAGARRMVAAGVRLAPALLHLPFLALVQQARLVLTDSGGVPLEASLLGVPCLTLRPRYEQGLTQSHGTNRLVGGDPRRLPAAVLSALARSPQSRPRGAVPAWDGHAAERIVVRWQAGVRRAAPPAREVGSQYNKV